MEVTAGGPGTEHGTQEVPAQQFDVPETPQQKALLNLVFRSMKRTHDMFYHDYGTLPELDPKADNLWRAVKLRSEYGDVLKEVNEAKRKKEEELLKLPSKTAINVPSSAGDNAAPLAIDAGSTAEAASRAKDTAVATTTPARPEDSTVRTMLPARAPMMIKPKWHAPWKLYRCALTYFLDSRYHRTI
ncbi:unnamed protein product [Gongylonema pulchrum]|uniref:HMG box domain-containing protein n=1 Tax=Gongylonema pulchrum TaxID=637853 RepID=A0A183D2S4_9BILA|nr:unnamed protein product [Gongylonema pulchrum]